MVDRLEAIVDRVERIVGLGEAAVAPLAATESAVRGVVNSGARDRPASSAAQPSAPTPPIAEGTGLPWDVTVGDAVAAIAEARARHGDTFVVQSGRDHYLFTFSPTGVESFYALPEEIGEQGLSPTT